MLLNNQLLHRDVSLDNIMLGEDESYGFLIDFDLAVELHSSAGCGMTGTKVFMAVGVLKNQPHSYMHDLESFFWVLYWICIHKTGPSKETRIVPEITEEWNSASSLGLCKSKLGTINPDLAISADFCEYCSPLTSCMEELRLLVFPNNQCRSKEDRGLYPKMINVLRKARNELADS